MTERQRHDLDDLIPALRDCIQSFSVLQEFREEKTAPQMKLEDMKKAKTMIVQQRKYKAFGEGLSSEGIQY